MKLKYVTGCICDSLSVDDKEFNELPLEEKKRILHHLIEHSIDENTLQELFIKYMECEGNCNIFGPCECCGDIVYQYDLERKDYVSIYRLRNSWSFKKDKKS